MPVLWSAPDLARRFSPYVEELHEFCASYGMHYGSPADLAPFAAGLELSRPFREDLASLLRSIILREGGSVPRADLLEILAIAAGGPDIDQASQELQPPLRRLLDFVNTVLRKPWNEPPGEAAPVAEKKTLQFPSPPAPQPVPQPAAPTSAPPAPAFVRPAAVFSRLDYAAQPTHPAPETLSPIPPAPPIPPASEALSPVPAAAPIPPEPIPIPPEPTPVPTIPPQPVPIREPELIRTAALVPTAARRTANPSLAAASIFRSMRPILFAVSGVAVVAIVLVLFLPPHKPPTPPAPPASVSTLAPTPPPAPAEAAKPSPDVVPAAPAAPAHATRKSADDGFIAAPYSTPILGEPPPSAPANQPPPAAAAAPSPAAVPTTASPRSLTPAPSSAGPPAAAPRPVSRSTNLVSSGMMGANLLSAPMPHYPAFARLTHVEGRVILQAIIAADGSVSAIRVISGHRLLRGAAVSAVRTWRYRPYLTNGRPVDVSTIITLDFHPAHSQDPPE